MRRALIDAAVDLVAERGLHGLSLREAARRAGVSSGAPYRHFADKDALLAAIAVEAFDRLQATMEQHRATAGSSALEQFRAMGIAYTSFAVANPSYFRVMCLPEFVAATANASPELQRAIESNQSAVEAILRASQDEGSMVAADRDVIWLTARALMHGLAHMLIEGHVPGTDLGPAEVERISRAVTEVLGHGLRPR